MAEAWQEKSTSKPEVMGKQHERLVVGQGAPTCLIVGLYNKLVKVAASGLLDHFACRVS